MYQLRTLIFIHTIFIFNGNCSSFSSFKSSLTEIEVYVELHPYVYRPLVLSAKGDKSSALAELDSSPVPSEISV